MDITKRQLLTLIILTFGNFFAGSIFSILAPFFPAEAEKKGATATEYGIIFGIYELIAFLCSPIYGKYLYKLGPRLVLNLGLLTESIGCLLFGTLNNCDGHEWFITLAFVFRVIQALGASAYITASFAVIAVEFPNSMAKTFAALETAFGAGLIAGPPIGGFLFEIGGYSLPFIVIGGGMLCSAIIAPCLTNEPTRNTPSQSIIVVQSSFEGNSGILQLLKIPGACIAALNVMSCGISNTFICTILEPHLRQFSLSPVKVTGVFVLLMGTYAVCTPGWGWLCSKSNMTYFVSLIGSTIMLIGCMLIGPVPFLPFNTILWVTCIGCALQGFGTGALQVSAFLQLMDWAKKNGFPDDVSTYGLTSGVWLSMLSLGSFIGPIAAGILYDNVGFRMGSIFCVAEHSTMILLQAVFIFWVGGCGFQSFRKRTLMQNQDTEIQPLLDNS